MMWERLKMAVKVPLMTVNTWIFYRFWPIVRVVYRLNYHARRCDWVKVRYPWENVDLVLESAGCCASSSFQAYIEKHNPGIRLGNHTHAPASVWYAQRKGIPAVVLSWNEEEQVKRRVYKYKWPRSVSRLRWRMMEEAGHRAGLWLPFWMYTTSPEVAVTLVNVAYGLDLNVGDGRIEHLNKTGEGRLAHLTPLTKEGTTNEGG